jgi:hypothetical protein
MSDKKFEQFAQLVKQLRKEADLESQDYKTEDLARAKRSIASKLQKILGVKQ